MNNLLVVFHLYYRTTSVGWYTTVVLTLIHIHIQDKSLQTLAFSEEDTEELFPEFAELPSR